MRVKKKEVAGAAAMEDEDAATLMSGEAKIGINTVSMACIPGLGGGLRCRGAGLLVVIGGN